MSNRLYLGFVGLTSYLLPDRLVGWLVPRAARRLRAHLAGELTQDFLLFVLGTMNFLTHLSRGYRRNLLGFTARCMFEKEGEGPIACALFARGGMTVVKGGVEDWDTRITFRSYSGVWNMLLQDEGVLQAVLDDDVMVEGNLNHVYRFGFLGSDLKQRLGLT